MAIDQLRYKKRHTSTSSVFKSIDSIKTKVQVLGFINADIDTVFVVDTIYFARYSMGKPYKKTKIFNIDIIGQIPTLSNYYDEKTEDYITLPTKKIPSLLNAIVAHYEAEGFPFVSVRLRDIKVRAATITAVLVVDTHAKRKIDKIILNGYKDFPKHLLPIKPSEVFNNRAINRLRTKIKQLPYVSEVKPPETLFTPDSTIVYLYLKKEAANSFDGLIGFNRNATTDKLRLNGYADLLLNNLFNAGERFTLTWNNNGQDRQDFETNLYLPQLFRSRFSTLLKLNILKQDTTFTTTNFNLSVPYQVNLKNNLGVTYKYERSAGLLEDDILTDISDYSGYFIGLNYGFSNLKPTPFLTNGLNFNLEILYGSRKSELVKNAQWLLSGSVNSNLPISKKSFIYLANETAWLQSGFYLDNELLRLGGINSIRGFVHNSLAATFYSAVTLEYRLLTNNNDYLYSISDIAAIRNNRLKENSNRFGLGLGYAFRTVIGNVNISYAIGNTFNENFSFNEGQLQVKIVNRF